MAPPLRKQQAAHQHAANLYAEQKVDTRTPLNDLVAKIASEIDGADADPFQLAYQGQAVIAAIKRAYPPGRDGVPRAARLWQGVLDQAQLPARDPKHVSMPLKVAERLSAELEMHDPLFAQFWGVLREARSAQDSATRENLLTDAAAALASVTPTLTSSAIPGPDTKQSRDLLVLLEKVGANWARVFELAVGDTGRPSATAQTLGRQAVHAGHAAQVAESTLRSGPHFGRHGAAPRQVEVYSVRGGRWVAAVAALEALTAASTDLRPTPAELVRRTRQFVGAELGVPPEDVDDTQVLTQSGWTLLRAGRRQLASEAVHAAWQAVTFPSAGPRRRRDAPEELLELAIELAGVQYSHGESEAAAQTLHGELRARLDGPAPGGPDDSWGEVVSYSFYRQLVMALDSPDSAVGPLRAAWTVALGPRWSTGYPNKWVLAGVTAEVLVRTGDGPSAATVAETSHRSLEEPTTPVEDQLRTHLVELFDGDRPPPRSESCDRAKALLAELVALAVAEPGVLDHAARGTLKGLTTLALPRYRRIWQPPRVRMAVPTSR